MNDILYKIRIDGDDVDTIMLSHHQHSTRKERDKVRRFFAKKYNILIWGIRLERADQKFIVFTDMKTGKTRRKYI